jgi:hypothetical protein
MHTPAHPSELHSTIEGQIVMGDFQMPSSTRGFFDQTPARDQLAAEQKVEAVDHANNLLGDFWPDDESAEEILITLRTWRHEGK